MKKLLFTVLFILPILLHAEFSEYPVILTKSDSSGRISISKYDVQSNLTELLKITSDQSWRYTFYFYDDRGSLTQEILTATNVQPITNSYSNVYENGLLKYVYHDQWVEEYFYNDKGLVTEIYHDFYDNLSNSYYLAYDYNQDGTICEEYFEYSDETWIVIVFEYDDQGRVNCDYLDNSNIFFRKNTYKYDDSGYCTSRTYESFFGKNIVSEYEYEFDNKGKMIEQKRSDSDGKWETISYKYMEIEDIKCVYLFELSETSH